MKQFIVSKIIQPAILALGASLTLYAYDKDLRTVDYFVHVPFWVGVVRPSGSYWISKFLKDINKGVFPDEMRTYRQMYLVSKNAILYDLLLNHTLYHGMLTVGLLTYMYTVNKFIISNTKLGKIEKGSGSKLQTKTENDSFLNVLKECSISLIRARVVFSSFSVLSEYWVSYFSLRSIGQSKQVSLPNNVKRALLLKQMLLSLSWSGYVLKQFYGAYLVNSFTQPEKETL